MKYHTWCVRALSEGFVEMSGWGGTAKHMFKKTYNCTPATFILGAQ